MAVPDWATNMSDLYIGGTGNFTKLGAGGAGLQVETDYYIIDSDCHSKDAFTNSIKGLAHDNGTGFTVPTSGAIIQFLYFSAVNALEVVEPGGSPSNGGLMFVEGSGVGDYNRYNIAGSDTLLFNSWVPYVVDPNTATPDDTVGTPTGTEQWVGVEANLPTTAGPSKGAPIAVGMSRYGRCDVEYIDGETADFNNFDGAEAFANGPTLRLGLIELVPGTLTDFYVQGFHSFGTSGTAVDFRDADKVILIRDTRYVTAAFNRFELINAGSNWEMTNIIFQALGTQSPGTWVITAGTLTAISCQWFANGTFSFLSTSSVTDGLFDGCGQITAPGTTMTGTKITGYEGSANSSALVWDVATDPSGELDDMVFEMGTTATHAIEFGDTIPSAITLTNIDFIGYSSSQDQNDSPLHFKDTTGTITVNVTGGSGLTSTSFRTDGATIDIVLNPVALTITVVDITDQSPIVGARVLVLADDVGPLPFEDSVSIVQTSGTATVTHNGHGFATNQWVLIEGCAETEYNKVGQIIVTGANDYTYSVDSGAASPATGTPISTAAIVNGTTDGSGIITDTRTYSSDQDIDSGRSKVREAAGPGFFKTSPVAGTISSSNGLPLTIQMIPDE